MTRKLIKDTAAFLMIAFGLSGLVLMGLTTHQHSVPASQSVERTCR